MLRSEFESEPIGHGERLAARLVAKFVFRHCLALSEIGGGDLSRGFVLAAILDANVFHLLSRSDRGRHLGGLTTLVPDESRRPISISALSRTLRMPYETTRRHVTKLIEDGACVRVSEKGVIVPSAWLANRTDMTVKMYNSLRGLLATLHDAGFDLEAMARTPLDAGAPPVAAQ